MAIRCDWLVLCQRVIEDQATHNLTLVDCLDRLQVPSFPWNHGGFAFAAYFSRDGADDAGEYEFRLVRLSEGQDDRIVFHDTGTWPEEVDRMRAYVNFQMLQATHPEVIRFRIDWRAPKRRWTHGPAVPLRVEQLPLTPELRAELDQLTSR